MPNSAEVIREAVNIADEILGAFPRKQDILCIIKNIGWDLCDSYAAGRAMESAARKLGIDPADPKYINLYFNERVKEEDATAKMWNDAFGLTGDFKCLLDIDCNDVVYDEEQEEVD